MVTANRLHTVEEYYFSKKLREVHAMKAAGAPIINLGIGSPDLAPPKNVISAITNSLTDASAINIKAIKGCQNFVLLWQTFIKPIITSV